ncbi:DNA replication/repair protein RecF [Christensenella sp. MSJ-20]|uniref:DNA replication/repair protein RecF n=1 Tax=Christensenella sp. MSJ-20 TaxID=2841518 RepID=UPI001C77D0FB|nr:DNA replication/repair protein RecF [Christensenella sp. MSJ-20]
MRITEIQLKDFRNYTSLSLLPGEGINLLMGQNAQGKTNLLEGVYLCCIGKSHRTTRDQEMIREGARSAYCGISVSRRDGGRKVEVLLSRDSRKRIQVLGVSIARMSQLMGHINCVFFSPEDLQLVKGGPSARRRFLDVTLCQLRPGYFTALYQYNNALAQRNAILKRYDPQKASTLAAFDATLSAYGGRIIAQRRAFGEKLRAAAQRTHSAIAQGEALDLSYRSQVEGLDEYACQASLLELLESRRTEDIRRFQTTAGPHRDDLVVEIAGRDGRMYGSQGQQRTAALALKLGAMELMREETGEMPVLMLDDVLSELDQGRQNALLSCIQGQAFITTAVPISGISGAGVRAFQVQAGVLKGTSVR